MKPKNQSSAPNPTVKPIPKTNQNPTKKYFSLTKEELAKVQRAKKANTDPIEVEPEDYFIAEFGFYFGWQGIKDVFIENLISLSDAQKLLSGARKVHYSHVVDDAQATLVATASPHTKHPGSTFRKGIKHFIDRMKLTS